MRGCRTLNGGGRERPGPGPAPLNCSLAGFRGWVPGSGADTGGKKVKPTDPEALTFRILSESTYLYSGSRRLARLGKQHGLDAAAKLCAEKRLR